MANQTDPRRRYLEIATHRFAERGFHGVTLAALADDAGVTKQALLYFFPTKERLYGEVLARLAERLSSKIDDIDAPTPEQRLVTYFEAHTNGALTSRRCAVGHSRAARYRRGYKSVAFEALSRKAGRGHEGDESLEGCLAGGGARWPL